MEPIAKAGSSTITITDSRPDLFENKLIEVTLVVQIKPEDLRETLEQLGAI